MTISATLHTDGGSRGNPGPAGCGFLLESQGGEIASGGWFLGETTNNVAEYNALIWGLRNAAAAGVETLHVQADSKLMIEQMRGAYKVKNAGIRPLYLAAKRLASGFAGGVTYEHVYRDKNTEADGFANDAMDAQRPVGAFLVTLEGEPVEGAPAAIDEPAEQPTAVDPFASLFSDEELDALAWTADAVEEQDALEGEDDELASIAADVAAVELDVEGFDSFELDDEPEADWAAVSEPVDRVEPEPAVIEPAAEHQPTVLLGVSGCIAAYKACEVLRGLQKAGVRVKVVMTRNGAEFVGPATFKALTHEEVAIELFDAPGDPVHHISLAEEADLMLVCPATANVLAKLACGIADDLLTTTALATQAPLLVAPAMNVHMWRNERTQRAVAVLKAQGVQVVEPVSGHLACGYEGEGKLAGVDDIVDAVLEALEREYHRPVVEHSLAGKRILVTAGPTHEPVDPVRFIGNRSSGKTGYVIAAQAARRGAQVTLVSGPVSIAAPLGVDLVRVQTADEMLAACDEVFDSCDAAVFCAAVADYRPAQASDVKIKKDPERPDEGLTLELVRNPDVIATLAARKADRVAQGEDPVYVVGFAAETGDPVPAAKAKLAAKHADLIVANDVSDPGLGFGTDDNRVWFVDEQGVELLERCPKDQIAEAIADRIARNLG